MSAARFDVAVAGAGMVGACAAFALAQTGYRVALIEALPVEAKPLSADDPWDLRVSAISPRSRAILNAFGLWQRLPQSRICEYEQMFIWHEHGEASVSFDAVDLARDNLGAIVENRVLQQEMINACRNLPAIEWFAPDRIESLLEQRDDGLTLRLDSGAVLEAGLLIAADGRHSPTRKLAGLGTRGGSYRQTAFVANVDTEKPHRHTAWQRFLATGPLAFLPLANGQSSIVWSCDDALAAEVAELDDKAFCDALTAAFEGRLGAVTATSERRSFPLGWHQCERWVEQRVVLIGDAAHSVHPLAGQGVNLGFSDVEALVGLLADSSRIVTANRLRRYERQRKSETAIASQSFGGLKWLYGLEQTPVALARDLGMRIVEKTPWLKRELMQKAVQNLT